MNLKCMLLRSVLSDAVDFSGLVRRRFMALRSKLLIEKKKNWVQRFTTHGTIKNFSELLEPILYFGNGNLPQ
ncbi:unnamed protein product [Rhizophagus irregularis]|nr:unnamed protein product [Rhizophagus irregularis]